MKKDKIDKKDLWKRFIGFAENTNDLGPRWIHESYKEFIKYFESIPKNEKISKQQFIIGSYFTYGWMPTMLKLGSNIKSAIEAVNLARESRNIISQKEFQAIAYIINGSVVGASKLLHFVNPKKYAIWDSRVYRFIFQEEAYQYRLEAPDLYHEYLNSLKFIIEKREFLEIKNKVDETVGYEVTEMRACELIMFSNGKK